MKCKVILNAIMSYTKILFDRLSADDVVLSQCMLIRVLACVLVTEHACSWPSPTPTKTKADFGGWAWHGRCLVLSCLNVL